MKKTHWIWALPLLLVGCNSANPAEAEKQEDNTAVEKSEAEVMELHDRVMADMNKMAQQRKRLTQKARGHEDSVVYLETARQLQNAHDRMMNWMRNYTPAEELERNREEVLQYLGGEKRKMEEIEAMAEDALARADSLLQN